MQSPQKCIIDNILTQQNQRSWFLAVPADTAEIYRTSAQIQHRNSAVSFCFKCRTVLECTCDFCLFRPFLSKNPLIWKANFFFFIFLRTTEIYWWKRCGGRDCVNGLWWQHGGWCWIYWLLSLTKRGEKIKMQTKTKRNLARKCELGSGGGEKSREKK